MVGGGCFAFLSVVGVSGFGVLHLRLWVEFSGF